MSFTYGRFIRTITEGLMSGSYCCNCRYYMRGKCTLTQQFMDKYSGCTKFMPK